MYTVWPDLFGCTALEEFFMYRKCHIFIYHFNLRANASRGQMDRGYKKPDTNTDIRTLKFVSDDWKWITEIAIR